MFFKIIENYINNLNKNDIILFANKNNINLSNKELDYIYNTIKKDYKLLLSDNYNIIFKNASNVIAHDKLKKIYNLFLDYRNKYINYLN